MFEFCICNGEDTSCCPFHDPVILELLRKKEKDKDNETRIYESSSHSRP